MKTPKQEALDLLERLPDDVSTEMLLDNLEFVLEVQKGLEQADQGLGIEQGEVERRLKTWLESSGRQRLSGT